jgi:hypothetical protein
MLNLTTWPEEQPKASLSRLRCGRMSDLQDRHLDRATKYGYDGIATSNPVYGAQIERGLEIIDFGRPARRGTTIPRRATEFSSDQSIPLSTIGTTNPKMCLETEAARISAIPNLLYSPLGPNSNTGAVEVVRGNADPPSLGAGSWLGDHGGSPSARCRPSSEWGDSYRRRRAARTRLRDRVQHRGRARSHLLRGEWWHLRPQRVQRNPRQQSGANKQFRDAIQRNDSWGVVCRRTRFVKHTTRSRVKISATSK